MTNNTNEPREQPLESWKEIAVYLKRDVRTVIRWEKREGLPVHRQLHQARSSVYAYPSELEAWKIDREPGLNALPVLTPWRRVTSAFAVAAAMLLALLTMGSGPIRTPTAAAAEPPDGIVNREVWSGPGIDLEGAPSPDGRYLSFVDWKTGDLAIHDLETGKNRHLTNSGQPNGKEGKIERFAEFSRWSPDGKQIAYDWYDGKCCVDLHVVALEAGKPRVLVDYKAGEQSWMQTYDWSPDGRQILTFLEKPGGSRQIVLVSAADGTTRVIKTFEGYGVWPQTMRFSRDGKYVAYDWPQQPQSVNRDIFLIPADGGKEIPLVRHPADDRLLGWPPDGKGILFASDRTGSMDIWFLPVSDGKVEGAPELIKAGVEGTIPMGFTQGGSFYYSQGGWSLDVYSARMDPKSGRILAPPKIAIKHFEGRNSWPAYSPDGNYLAYVTTRSRTFQAALRPNILCIRSLETGKEQEFKTKFGRLAGTRWSPDGQSLYLAAWDDKEGLGVYRVNAQTGEFSSIVRVKPPARLHRHEISPDGNTLVYGRQNDWNKPYRILSRDLTTGEEKQLAASRRAMFSISPDGRWLAMIKQDEKETLQVVPLGGGEPRELLRVKEAGSHFGTLAYTADGKFILFTKLQLGKDKDNLRSLWRIPAEGGEPQQLNLVMAGIQALSVYPDGQHFAFTSRGFTERAPAIWVMENFLPKTVASK